MELTLGLRTSGAGKEVDSGSLKTGGLENQMEGEERTAWRWRLLVQDCGMMLTAVEGAGKRGTQAVTTESLLSLRGSSSVFSESLLLASQ